jgi:type I restriction enzyme S subunit
VTWKRLSHVADVSVSTVDKHTVEGEVPVRLCNYVDVYKNDLITDDLAFMNATATADEIQRFSIAPGDTLFTKDSETADDIGVPAYVAATSPLVCGYHVAIARPRLGEIKPRFLFWALASSAAAQQWSVLAAGVTRVGLRQGDIGKLSIWVPDHRAQDAIALFLDRETAKIDALIAKQAQLARDVGERVDARWAHEVETLTRDADVVPLRRVVESIVDGPFGSSLTSAHYSHSGARVIRLGNIGLASFRDEDRAYIPDEYARELAAHSVFPGDLVVAGLGDDRWPLGRATVVPDLGVPAIVKADCYRIRPRRSVTASYLAWVLSSPPLREQFQLLSRGSTRSRLNTQLVREALVPVPPPEIQRRVALDHEAATKRHNVLRNSSRLLQTRLSERRAALITAAVTGTLDVTTYGKAG